MQDATSSPSLVSPVPLYNSPGSPAKAGLRLPWPCAGLLGLLLAGGPLGAAPTEPVWHVESWEGRTIESRGADAAINPASVVKLATTLWALERLGAGHRFSTRFGIHGTLDAGALEGNLVVRGGADPDFHVENAYLVARELNRAGLLEVRGALLVDDSFWIGWEGGRERREADPRRRAAQMAARLRDALDPARFGPETRSSIEEFRKRRGFTAEALPRVVVRGKVGQSSAGEPATIVVEHRSNPLAATLKRLNAFSNNDIERLGASLGSADALAESIERRWNDPEPAPRLETLSGLGSNRMSCRQIVRLLRELVEACRRHGLDAGDLLPVTGCDPGTLEHFPVLDEERLRGALVAKTGTLAETDGGVAVLAGLAHTGQGDRLFCIATPGIGHDAGRARAAQSQWLLDWIARQDGPRPGSCGASVVYSDDEAVAEVTVAPPAR